MRRYRSPQDSLSIVRGILASTSSAAEILEQIAETLYNSRGYDWVAIYLENGDALVRRCYRGPIAAHSFSLATGDSSATVVSIRIAARVLGTLEVQGGKAATPQDRVLLTQTADLLARFLTTDKAKLLLRKSREFSAKPPAKVPQSARPRKLRAAAGDHSAQ